MNCKKEHVHMFFFFNPVLTVHGRYIPGKVTTDKNAMISDSAVISSVLDISIC